MIKRILTGTSVLTISALALAGCSTASAQTVEEACGIVETTVLEISDIQEQDEFPITEMNKALDKATKEITNKEVADAWESFSTPSKKLVKMVQDIEKENDTDAEDFELQDELWNDFLLLGQEVEQGAENLLTVCPSLENLLEGDEQVEEEVFVEDSDGEEFVIEEEVEED